MLRATTGWAVNKLAAFVFPLQLADRPRSTLDGVVPPKAPSASAGCYAFNAGGSVPSKAPDAVAFEARYWPLVHPPRNSAEAQQLYNHIRTVAWYLDSIPFLGSRLPFNIGIESILGVIPGIGDYIGLALGLYQILLCSLFGVPLSLLLWMLVNVVVDCIIGIVPLLGDALDVLFKANLRNLRLLEDHLYESRGRCGAGVFYIQFPPNDVFLTPGRSSTPSRNITRPSRAPFNHPLAPPSSSKTSTPTFYLSLPASVAGQPASNSSGSAAPPIRSPDHSHAPSQEESGTAQTSTDPNLQMNKADTAVASAKVEAYAIPEESSTSTRHRDTIRDYGQGTSSSEAEAPALDGNDAERAERGGRSKSRANAAPPYHPDGLPSDHTADSAMEDAVNVGKQPLHLAEMERPRVSWSDAAWTARSQLLKADDKRPSLDAFSNDGSDVNEVPEDQRLLKNGRLEREQDADDARALWRKRRGLYLLVYSAIFCVAYVSSLDSNTGYLYLNFACSEYGALASFSTVAIVQQMVFAIAKPPIAKLSDVVGRPQAYVLSLCFYVCGYLVVASTSSLRSLIGGICLQSAGTTGIQVLQSIIIADTTTAKWRGLVIGIVNLPFLINFAVAGPMVDLVMRHGGWRFGFAIWTVVMPLAATPLLLTLLVGQRRAQRAGLATRSWLRDKPWRSALRQLATELDVVGLLLFTGGWLLILLPLTLAGHGERQAEVPMATFIAGGVGLLVVFGWWETRASVPILPYQFLTNSAVVCTCVVGVLDFASFYISWTFLSSFVQILKGWDQTRTGYFATTQNVTSTITGIVVGSLMAMTRRYKVLLVIGLVVRLLGVTLMVRYRTAEDPTYMLVLCQLLQGIGGGSIAITMQVAVQVTVRHADVAIVTALELLTTEIGAAIGSATAGWLFQTYLPAKLATNLPGMDAEELKLVYGSLQKALSYPLGTAERDGIIQSWVEVMRMLSIVATVTLVPAVLFGLAIPDTALPDVHGGAQSHHHHHHHHHHHRHESHHHHHHGTRRGDRRSVRRRPSFLSTSRPSSPLEVRAGYADPTLAMGVGASAEGNATAGFLSAAGAGSKRSRSVSRNRASGPDAREEAELQRKKPRSRRAVLP